jgi:hypothetical protein
MGGDHCGFMTGGEKRGGAHGAVAREEGEAALGRREEEEGRVAAWAERRMGRLAAWAERPNGPAGHVGREAACEGKEFPD